MILALFSLSTAIVLFMRTAFDSCPTNTSSSSSISKHFEEEKDTNTQIYAPNPLDFMKSKLVLMVSHELSLSGTLYVVYFPFVSRERMIYLSKKRKKNVYFRFIYVFFYLCTGGPLLLMELAFLLRGVGSEVVWITNQKPAEPDDVVYSLEHKMLDRGVQVINSSSQFT